MNGILIGFAILFLPAIWLAELIAIPIYWIMDKCDEFKRRNE